MTLPPLHIQTARDAGRTGLSDWQGKTGQKLDRRSGEADERVRYAPLAAEGARYQSLRHRRYCASGRMLIPAVAEQRGRGAFLVEARGFHEQE